MLASSTMVVTAFSAIGPLFSFIKAEAISEFAKGMVGEAGGNFFTAVKPKFKQLVVDRFTAGKLPANHDIAKASRAALGSALQWMAHELSGQVPLELRGEVLRRIDGGQLASQIVNLDVPPEYGEWVKALIKLARDDAKLQKLEQRELNGQDVENLLTTRSDADLAAELHRRIRAWLESNLAGVGTAPDQLDEFLSWGWPVEKARLTLYQAWCIFFRECIKDEQKVFNSFVATALADMLDKKNGLASSRDFANEFGSQLTARLDELLPIARDTLDAARAIGESTQRIEAITRGIEGKLDALKEPTASAYEWPKPMIFTTYVNDQLKAFTGRSWLTARVLQWLRTHEPGTKQAILIQAPFGVGKTAFMAKLAKTLDDEGIHRAVHFCRFDEQDTLQPGRIVRSLAAQLKELLPAYRAAVETDHEAQKALDSASSDPAAAWSRAVVDPLDALARPEHAESLVVLLIDGLDESEELHRAGMTQDESLLDMIVKGTASRLPRWIRIVISARDELPQLEAQASRFERIHMLQDRGLANREDLECFIRARSQSSNLKQSIAGAGMDEDGFVEGLANFCNGKFLLAHYFMQEVETIDFDKKDLRGVLLRGHLGSTMDTYFEWVFQKRLKRLVVNKSKTEAVVGLIAVALTPLSAVAIADVLRDASISEQEVDDVVAAFGGLLTRDDHGGITFDHLSIEQWLDRWGAKSRPEGKHAGRGDFEIGREASMARLQEHCRRMVMKPVSELNKRDFFRYLSKHGVVHLTDAGDVEGALALLMRLPFEAISLPRVNARRSLSAVPPRRLETRVIDAIHKALQDHDRVLNEGGVPTDSPLVGLDINHLYKLLESRDYETGKYGPILRSIIQFKRVDVQAFKTRYAGELADDLVFRCDFGVALADAWFNSRGQERDRLIAAIEALAISEDADDREIAGYALKHICQKIDPRPWWLDIEPKLRELAARYALSDEAVDRMVGGEMLLALTLQDAPVRDWFLGLVGADRFWRPYWANLRMDIEAMCAYSGTKPTPQVPLRGEDHGSSFEAARHQGKRAADLASAFKGQPIFDENKQGRLWRLQWAIGSLKDQQCDKVALDESLDDLLQLVDDDKYRTLIFNIVSRLMLHPSWDLTEAGASLVADLIKRKGRVGGPWWLIDDLLKSSDWRLLYGAVDAAYNVGGVDGFQKFKEALLAVGRLEQCRVRGICADNLRMWVKKSSSLQKVEILTDRETRALMHCWLTTADDIWLLEYLHLLFSELWNGSEDRETMQALVRSLMPDTLSHYLTLDPGTPFYIQTAEAFLTSVEAWRRAEWEVVNR